MDTPIRVLVGKVGLDGHERGAKAVARALRDAGMEVIYCGVRSTPQQIVTVAGDEDVDVIGLSILSGAHIPLCTDVARLASEAGLDDVVLIVGGIIPPQDVPALHAIGFAAAFGSGSKLDEVVSFVSGAVHRTAR
jgi:methylmalonyl-CoA mutase C-terminal domain/subunit